MLKLKISEVTSNAHIQKDNELKALQVNTKNYDLKYFIMKIKFHFK